MNPTPFDLLRLWHLAAHGGEALQKEMKPEMERARRLAYLERNLIEQTQASPIKVRLTEHGWNFLLDHMTDSLAGKSPAAGAILSTVFVALHRLMQERNIHIHEIFPLSSAPQPVADKAFQPQPQSQPQAAAEAPSLWERFFSIWEKNHLTDSGLLLRDLRPALPDVSREKLDETLLSWQTQEKIEIFPFDDFSRITPEDKAAAITIAGREAYIILLK